MYTYKILTFWWGRLWFAFYVKKRKSLHFYLLNFMLEYVHESWGFEVCKICCWRFFFLFFEKHICWSLWKVFGSDFFKITMHICRFEFWFKLWNLLLVIPLFLLNMVMKQVKINWLMVNVIDQEFNITLLPIH